MRTVFALALLFALCSIFAASHTPPEVHQLDDAVDHKSQASPINTATAVHAKPSAPTSAKTTETDPMLSLDPIAHDHETAQRGSRRRHGGGSRRRRL